MTKTKANASWNELSAEQRETLDQWLFDENLSYAKAWPRAQAELGFKGFIASLKRYYQRRSQERAMESLEELVADAAEVKGSAGGAEILRQATMKLLAAQAFQQVRETPEEPEKWVPAVKLMVESDRNETMREGQKSRHELRAEDHEIRREAIEFGRQKFEFDIVERAVRALPELQKLAEAVNDPDPKRYSDRKSWGAARDAVFGKEFQGGDEAPSDGEAAKCGMEDEAPNPKLQAPAPKAFGAEKQQTPSEMTKDK